MRRRVYILAAVLTALLIFAAMPAYAAEDSVEFQREAEILSQLGLFRGIGVSETGEAELALERSATRLQGVIMLLRLLGEEEAALAYTGDCTFADLSGNGARYAAYAYSRGYVNGTGEGTFGNGALKANAFLTLMLRALGYDDRAGDFTYSTAIFLAEEVGLISRGEYVAGSAVLQRDDCVEIAYNALLVTPQGGSQMLVQELIEAGVVSTDAAAATAITEELPACSALLDYDAWHTLHDSYMDQRVRAAAQQQARFYGLDADMGWVSDPDTTEEFWNNVLGCFLVGDYSLSELTVREETFAREMYYYVAENRVELFSSYAELMGAFVNPLVNWVQITLRDEENDYFCSQYSLLIPAAPIDETELYRQQLAAQEEAQRIVTALHESEEIIAGMDPIRVARIYYNYLQQGDYELGAHYNSVERQETMCSDTAYACLVNRKANCLGRAAAYTMLLNLEGLDVQTVHCWFTFSPQNEKHVLNRFVVNGQEYVCDWYNYLPIMPLEMSYNWVRYSALSLEIARARA